MELNYTEILVSLAIGIGLAAATGFRVFLPLFVAGLVLRFGIWTLPAEVVDANAWLASNAALVCFGVACIAEVLAYKIPFIDHGLDVIGAPLAMIAGAALASSFFTGFDAPVVKYGLGIIAGAGTAGVIHAGTALTRVASTKTTAGLGNPVFSLAELGASLVTTLLSFIVPLLIAFIVLTVIGVFVALYLKSRNKNDVRNSY
jgi:hypothetical protein